MSPSPASTSCAKAEAAPPKEHGPIACRTDSATGERFDSGEVYIDGQRFTERQMREILRQRGEPTDESLPRVIQRIAEIKRGYGKTIRTAWLPRRKS